MYNNFKGGFGGGNMQNLFRQAQKMQEEMEQKQRELEETEGGLRIFTMIDEYGFPACGGKSWYMPSGRFLRLHGAEES